MSEETTVVCSRIKEELPAITSRITFAGEFGDRIKREVSQRAWNEWLEMQIKIINEYRLHLGEPAHREALQDFATKFFCFDGGDGSLGSGQGPEGGL
ncbi:MAG: Fe(2+)-trafficking protein [Myxococcota bacterium]|nr:Fe(2+)-trafficking protein [Myxococcota bacterium]